MKYKSSVGAVMVLATMSLMAAQDRTIYVTTYEDEDGENSSQCSLREAITTASTGKAYGGCSIGITNPSAVNIIQLKAGEKGKQGEYKITRGELKPTSSITILGEEPYDYTRPDVLTGEYPAFTDVKSSIRAIGKHRIFNTTELNNPALKLQNINLHGGYSDQDGGAIYAGGSVELANVSIYDAQARQGGAIFLNDAKSTLLVAKGNFKNNQAQQGSVLGMTCTGNLGYIQRRIEFNNISFIANGSAQSQSIFQFCGEPSAVINASTISNNMADANTGRIIQFSRITPQGAVAMSTAANLNMHSNTVVNNQAYSTLIYDQYSRLSLDFNIFAFNAVNSAQAKSCRYMGNDPIEEVKNLSLNLGNNALKLKTGTDQCDIPETIYEETQKKSIELNNYRLGDVLIPMSTAELTEYTAFMPMYFPNVKLAKNPLIDTGKLGCSNVDQRGVNRMAAENSVGDQENENTCDVGSTEVLRLTAANILAGNVSVTTIIDGYNRSAKTYRDALANPNLREEFKPYYEKQLKRFEAKAKYTAENRKYRPAYIDVFVSNLPDEEVLENGQRQIKLLNPENYDVSVKSLGVGMLKDRVFVGRYDPNLICEWNKDLESVIMYRTDDRITASGDNEFCEYTLSLKGASPAKTSTAYIMTNFVNVFPVAKNFSVTVQEGATQAIVVDLLGNTNDDGDGDVKYLKNKTNKPSYFVNDKGQDLAIRLGKVPDAVQVTAERSGACPGFDSKETCYGGQIKMQLKNTFDPFVYKVPYMVYDADGAVSSQAIVELKNTGSPDGNRGGGSSGGGALGWLSLGGLFALSAIRQRKIKASSL